MQQEEGGKVEQGRTFELLTRLVAELCEERGIALPEGLDEDQLWDAFRALVNTREPLPISDLWLARQDELLQEKIAQAGIHTLEDAVPSPRDPRLMLWQGDITTLAVDAIVNAANNRLLGCWQPHHYCIDNAIHTFAGVQLRLACARIMEEQGYLEPTGMAKITSAFNLPAQYVIHTVGPIANGAPTDEHRRLLASCYQSCLELAAETGLSSIAFCCISTGVFGFPQQEAAEIALGTVQNYLEKTESHMQVVFNVFRDDDLRIYQQLMSE